MDHRHKVFMASGNQHNVPWPGLAIFPGELRGSPRRGNVAAAPQRGEVTANSSYNRTEPARERGKKFQRLKEPDHLWSAAVVVDTCGCSTPKNSAPATAFSYTSMF